MAKPKDTAPSVVHHRTSSTVSIDLKQCAKCKEIKPESAFSPNRNGKDGRHHVCKACRSAQERHRRNRLIADSKCTICAKHQAASGIQLCKDCAKNQRTAAIKYRLKRANTGGLLDKYLELGADDLRNRILDMEHRARVMRLALKHMGKGEPQ